MIHRSKNQQELELATDIDLLEQEDALGESEELSGLTVRSLSDLEGADRSFMALSDDEDDE